MLGNITTPNYDMLKVFGCLCYATSLKRDRHKFDPRASPCDFIGHAFKPKRLKKLQFEHHNVCATKGHKQTAKQNMMCSNNEQLQAKCAVAM